MMESQSEARKSMLKPESRIQTRLVLNDNLRQSKLNLSKKNREKDNLPLKSKAPNSCRFVSSEISQTSLKDRKAVNSPESYRRSIQSYKSMTSPLYDIDKAIKLEDLRAAHSSNFGLKFCLLKNPSLLKETFYPSSGPSQTDLTSLLHIYGHPSFLPPIAHSQILMSLSSNLSRIHEQLLKELPTICPPNSSNFPTNPLSAHLNHRTAMIELQTWLKHQLKNPPTNQHQCIEYKQKIMATGMKQMVRIARARCKEEGDMLETVWDSTWSICRQIIVHLGQRAQKSEQILLSEIQKVSQTYKSLFVSLQSQLQVALKNLSLSELEVRKYQDSFKRLLKKYRSVRANHEQTQKKQKQYENLYKLLLEENMKLCLEVGNEKQREWVKKMYKEIAASAKQSSKREIKALINKFNHIHETKGETDNEQDLDELINDPGLQTPVAKIGSLDIFDEAFQLINSQTQTEQKSFSHAHVQVTRLFSCTQYGTDCIPPISMIDSSVSTSDLINESSFKPKMSPIRQGKSSQKKQKISSKLKNTGMNTNSTRFQSLATQASFSVWQSSTEDQLPNETIGSLKGENKAEQNNEICASQAREEEKNINTSKNTQESRKKIGRISSKPSQIPLTKISQNHLEKILEESPTEDKNLSQRPQKEPYQELGLQLSEKSYQKSKIDRSFFTETDFQQQMEVLLRNLNSTEFPKSVKNQNFPATNKGSLWVRNQTCPSYSFLDHQQYLREQLIVTQSGAISKIPWSSATQCSLDSYFEIVREVNSMNNNHFLSSDKRCLPTIEKTIDSILYELVGQMKKELKNMGALVEDEPNILIENMVGRIRGFSSMPSLLLVKFARKYGMKILALKHLKTFLQILKENSKYSSKFALVEIFMLADTKPSTSEDLFFYILMISLFDPYFTNRQLQPLQIDSIRKFAKTILGTPQPSSSLLAIRQDPLSSLDSRLSRYLHQTPESHQNITPLIRSIVIQYRIHKIQCLHHLGFLFPLLSTDISYLTLSQFHDFLIPLNLDSKLLRKILTLFLQYSELAPNINQPVISEPIFPLFLAHCPLTFCTLSKAILKSILKPYCLEFCPSVLSSTFEIKESYSQSYPISTLLTFIPDRQNDYLQILFAANPFLHIPLKSFCQSNNNIATFCTDLKEKNNSLLQDNQKIFLALYMISNVLESTLHDLLGALNTFDENLVTLLLEAN